MSTTPKQIAEWFAKYIGSDDSEYVHNIQRNLEQEITALLASTVPLALAEKLYAALETAHRALKGADMKALNCTAYIRETGEALTAFRAAHPEPKEKQP